MPSSGNSFGAHLLHPVLLAGAALVAGLSVSALLAWQVDQLIDDDNAARFDRLQEKTRNELKRRFTMPRYGLHGARGVYAASMRVERGDFARYVESRDLAQEFPGILGFGVIKPVPRAGLDGFIAAERKDGAPDFQVKTSGDDPQCYVITSIVPQAPNAAAWGLDVGAERVRRQGIDLALDTKDAALTRVITLVQDGEHTPGFLMLVPCFTRGMPTTTPAERQAALDAFVYAPIRAVDLLANLDRVGDGLVESEVWEGSPHGDGTRLFPLDGRTARKAAFTHAQVLPLFGRDIHLMVQTTPAFERVSPTQKPFTLFLVGALISLLTATVILLQGRSRARVLAAARAMTQDLREAKVTAEQALRDAEIYRSTLEQYAIVSMTDATGRIIHANAAFCAISGYTREELLGKDHRLVNSGTHGPEFWRTMWSTVLGGKPWRGVVCNRAKDGSLYWVDSLITPFTAADGTLDRLVSIRFDVTAQKKLEQEVATLNERHRLALLAGAVGIWEYHPVAGSLVWDERMYQLYGVDPQRFSGAYAAWESAIHPDDKARSVAELGRALSGEQEFDTGFRVVWPDGSVHHIRARAVVTRAADGTAIRMVGTNWDVTTERELEAQRQVLTTILDQAPDFIATKGLDGRVQWHNPASARLLGLPAGTDLTDTALDQLHPVWAIRQLHDVAMPAAISDGVWTGESALLHHDGTEVPVSQVLMIHRDPDGKPLHFSTIIRDLRKQRSDAANLRTLSLMQRGILDSANVTIIAGDPNGIITHWNATATRMLQWTADEMIGKQTPAVLHLPEEVLARAAVLTAELGVTIEPGFESFVAKARIKRVADEQEWTYVRKDGTRFPVLLSITALWDNDGKLVGYLGIGADITERSRQQRELKLAMEAAKAGAQAKAEFLAVMSHEIRTPMNGVIGMTNLLVKTDLDAQQRDYVETVRSCGESLLTLINDILDFSKLEAGRVTLEHIAFPPARLIEEVVALFSGQAEQKGLHLACDLPADLPPSLIGDPTRLRQILLNLVSNAMKFTLRGSVRVGCTVRGITDGQAQLAISVQDTGVGMTPAQIARLGEAFTQADSSTTRRFGGTGLGMTISKALVHLMQGDLQIESVPDQGSTFRVLIRLPIGGSPADAATLQTLGKRRVLCLDNEATSLEVMADLCRSWDMQVETFTSAQDLMVRLRRTDQLPDLVLTDHEMPGIDGVMLTRMIHADDRYAAMPVVIASSDPERARREARTMGGIVVDKPLERMVLEKTLRQALSRPDAGKILVDDDHVPIRLGRVLVADDNRINLRVIVSMLKHHATTIDTAENGALAVQAVEREAYDCVLMDCQMPEMDGYQATQAIRAREQAHGLPHLPIIALTAHAMEGAREECLAAGMDDYLSKPVREADLRGVLKRWFGPGRATPPPSAPAPEPTRPDPVAALRANLEDDDVRQVAEAVVSEYPRLMAAVDQASEAGDNSGVRRIAHSLKGSGASLGIDELEALGRDLEQQARTASPEVLRGIIARLHQATAHTVRAFRNYLGGGPTP